MLNIITTTIKCPTKLSHFRDQWDNIGKSYAFTRDPTRYVRDSRPHRSTGLTPKGVTLTFSWDSGTWDKIGTWALRPPAAHILLPMTENPSSEGS
jgi:hypothetical protein